MSAKTPSKNNFVSSSFRRLTHLYDAYFIIIISYVFYINSHLSMITVYEAIYFYVFQQCLDVEHQYIFLTGLVISVLCSWVSPWQSRFGFKFSHDAKFQTKELFGLCNVMHRSIKNESTSKIFKKIFHISFKRGFMCPSSAFSQYLYVVASWLPFFTNFYNYFFLIFSYFIQKGLFN